MFLVYLGEVFKRALTPTPRMTDGLQVIAASAFPAVSKFFGVKMPTDIGNDTLAYIGAATLAFIFIRLIWAPYSIWKEDKVAIGDLKLELTKPERMVMHELAKHRARAITDLAKCLHEMGLATFADHSSRMTKISKLSTNSLQLATQAGFHNDFMRVLIKFADICRRQNPVAADAIWAKVFESIIDFINGKITLEVLQRQLPQDIETETPL